MPCSTSTGVPLMGCCGTSGSVTGVGFGWQYVLGAETPAEYFARVSAGAAKFKAALDAIPDLFNWSPPGGVPPPIVNQLVGYVVDPDSLAFFGTTPAMNCVPSTYPLFPLSSYLSFAKFSSAGMHDNWLFVRRTDLRNDGRRVCLLTRRGNGNGALSTGCLAVTSSVVQEGCVNLGPLTAYSIPVPALTIVPGQSYLVRDKSVILEGASGPPSCCGFNPAP